MSINDWMNHLLGDARDRALQASQATIRQQQQQLALAEARIAELAARLAEEQARALPSSPVAAQLEQLELDYGEIRDELVVARRAIESLQFEYGKAAIRGRMLEVRFAGLLRHALGTTGVMALLELIEARGVDDPGPPSGAEQRLLDWLAEGGGMAIRGQGASLDARARLA
ncbi:hypothetical protein ACNOYE_02755 [Nannocystaceae bacterium ST9]